MTLTFQRQGENLLLEVDGRAQVRQTELLPLTGAGTEGAAIRNWASNAVVESLAIYRRSMPRKAGPLVAADALVEVGQLLSALGQYVNVADDYRDSRLGELALAKACRLCGDTPRDRHGDVRMPSPTFCPGVSAVPFSRPSPRRRRALRLARAALRGGFGRPR